MKKEEDDGKMDFRSKCRLLVERPRDGGGNFPRRCSLKMKADLADPPDLAAYQNQEGQPPALCVSVCAGG